MRLSEIIIITFFLCLFSSILRDFMVQVRKVDLLCEDMRNRTESLNFISKSFCNTCCGKGFSNLFEWKKTCSVIWNLESIEYECVNNDFYKGCWCGKYGSGEVFCKLKKESE